MISLLNIMHIQVFSWLSGDASGISIITISSRTKLMYFTARFISRPVFAFRFVSFGTESLGNLMLSLSWCMWVKRVQWHHSVLNKRKHLCDKCFIIHNSWVPHQFVSFMFESSETLFLTKFKKGGFSWCLCWHQVSLDLTLLLVCCWQEKKKPWSPTRLHVDRKRPMIIHPRMFWKERKKPTKAFWGRILLCVSKQMTTMSLLTWLQYNTNHHWYQNIYYNIIQ